MWLTGVGYAGCATANDQITQQCCSQANGKPPGVPLDLPTLTTNAGLYAYYVNGTMNGCAATDTTTNLSLAGFNQDTFKSCASQAGYLSICTLGPLAGSAPSSLLRLNSKSGYAMTALLLAGMLALA